MLKLAAAKGGRLAVVDAGHDDQDAVRPPGAGLGDLMPPTALAGLFAAQVVGVKNYFSVLKVCLLPAIVTAIWGIMIILGANWYPF